MARAIDSSYLLQHKRKVMFFGLGPDDERWGYAVPVEVIESAHTLTPPNEPLTCEGCACEEYRRDTYPCNCCARNDETISDQYRPPEGEEDT